MPKFMLPYGETTMEVAAPSSGYQGTFLPVRDDVEADSLTLIHQALEQPFGSKPLSELVTVGQKVVIVISDLTRPCPSDVMLPPVLAQLNTAGIVDADITIVVALGLHRKMSAAELQEAVGEEIYRRITVLNHDIDDVITIGTTKRGTLVQVFRPVVEADVRICLGNVEFHYFAGFSGGAKAIIPGIASATTVNANHAHMIKDSAVAASLTGNPVREDLEEGVAMVGVEFILNVVVSETHQIMAAAAGDVTLAHRQLCQYLTQSGMVIMPEKVDIAIVSAGGNPKDINLYQAQKALDNIANVIRPGGIMILLARCEEGFGSSAFEQWLTSGKSCDQLLADIQQEFILGGHKAAAIAMVAKSIGIYLVSDHGFGESQLVGLELYHDHKQALADAFATVADNPQYAVFPLGASTLPAVRHKEENADGTNSS